jgi:5-amino-6-(5-phosphoribosylamino)uracil reductase
MTVDGKVSTPKLTPSGFTSDMDKRRLLEVRALGDALMVGLKTAEIDRMSMGLPDESLRKARTQRGQSEYPIRVLVTNSGNVPSNLQALKYEFSPILIYSTNLMLPSVRTELGPKARLHLTAGDHLDLAGVLSDLYERYAIRTLVCEGGPRLARSLAELDLIDEFFLTIAPLIAGGRAAPGVLGAPGTFLPSSRFYVLESMKVEADECYLHYVASRAACTRPTRQS